ncbi:MAG: hypothetical protein DMD82_01600 [Candidatus Rokuibacteriota bacterium]|nr:MAG: hypothetical protein DMD82_01600 [Candidatus Rokubacteria bacterium]
MSFALLAALILPATATASPWSISVRAARGHIAGTTLQPANPRLGLEVDLVHAVNKAVGLGFGCSWWEELGSQGFAYAIQGPDDPSEEHQREIAVGALFRVRGRLNYTRPYLLLGAGDYLTIHQDRYPASRIASRLDYAPGLSVGAGISGSTRPAAVLEVRWHRIFANSDPYNLSLKTTDILVVSAGLSFN